MEIWDAYHRDGTLAGTDLDRGRPIPIGLFHLVSEILVRHTDGSYLLMKRDPTKKHWGGYEEATAGGSALKGENGLVCAKRELTEETGITDGIFTEIDRFITDNTIYILYLCTTDCAKDSIITQPGETVSYRWLNSSEFSDFIRSDIMIPSLRTRFSPYFISAGLL